MSLLESQHSQQGLDIIDILSRMSAICEQCRPRRAHHRLMGPQREKKQEMRPRLRQVARAAIRPWPHPLNHSPSFRIPYRDIPAAALRTRQAPALSLRPHPSTRPRRRPPACTGHACRTLGLPRLCAGRCAPNAETRAHRRRRAALHDQHQHPRGSHASYSPPRGDTDNPPPQREGRSAQAAAHGVPPVDTRTRTSAPPPASATFPQSSMRDSETAHPNRVL